MTVTVPATCCAPCPCHLHVDASSVTHDENNGAENATWNGKDICDIYASTHTHIQKYVYVCYHVTLHGHPQLYICTWSKRQVVMPEMI